MALSASAKDYLSRFFPGPPSPLWETDPEFMELFANFALDEVVNQGDLDDAARMMAILAALLGCQGVEEYRVLLPAALRAGITPVQVKEILYQSVAYLGIGRVRPFFSVTNQVLTEQGVALPLEPGSTTTAETRLAAGNQAQVDIFGEGMRGFQNSGPEESRHINRWLADNCFGDYYTRGGLDYKQREMITFCFLAALGGCEPPAHQPRRCQSEDWKRQCLPDPGHLPVPALHRLSPQPERPAVCERRGPGRPLRGARP